MKSPLPLLLTSALLCMPYSGIFAAQIQCAGVLGNSGEQGASLVRFGPGKEHGLGVVFDDSGSLWDRGGDGVLNRYALDGRLLATYKIPLSQNAADKITRVGNALLLDLSGKLYTLALDAAPNSAATPLGIQADMMSFGTVGNAVAIATVKDRKDWTVSLFDLATKQVTPLVEGTLTGLQAIELTPDNRLIAQIADKLHLYRNGQEVTESGWPHSGPGDRLQWLDGSWYGSAWHGTIRRFNEELEPDPGVVLGGGSGAFIGHVDGNPEVEASRGLAKIRDGLFAASGMYGIVHLLHWDNDHQQFSLARRIGAVPACQGLGINKQGQVWFNFGYWNWNDSPAGFMHDCTSAGPSADTPGIGQLVMLPNDNFVAPEIRGNRDNVLGGPFSWNVYVSDLKTSGITGFLNGSAVYMDKKILTLLAINAAGQGKTYRIDNSGRFIAELGRVMLEPQDQVKEWTSLVLKNNDTLLGAGDGFVIEMVRDGNNWRETRRWNSWKGAKPDAFGEKIYIASDAGNLWVSDTKNHRVLCFAMADNSVRASFGATGQPGDDLSHLNEPCTLAAREARAVVFDSKNQRLVKLTLSE